MEKLKFIKLNIQSKFRPVFFLGLEFQAGTWNVYVMVNVFRLCAYAPYCFWLCAIWIDWEHFKEYFIFLRLDIPFWDVKSQARQLGKPKDRMLFSSLRELLFNHVWVKTLAEMKWMFPCYSSFAMMNAISTKLTNY